MRSSTRKKTLAALLVICVLIEPVLARRSGGSHSRGASAGRSGGGFSGSRSRTGTSGGGGYHSNAGSNNLRGGYGSSNAGGRQSGIGGWFGNNRKSNTGGGFFKPSHHNSKFNKGSGLGSMVRSNTFKNAIVGAAAGYLTYQAGKHLIRSAISPMMWGGRPYYWGSNYYQSRPGQSMCRMPIDPSDSQFGNIYFQDQSRPREITWGCNYGEVCCGYECCPGGYGGGGYGGGGFFRNGSHRSFQFGSLLVLLLISCCACFLFYRVCQRNSNTYQRA